MSSFHKHIAFRLSVIGLCVLTLIIAATAIAREPSARVRTADNAFASAPIVEDELVPEHREATLPLLLPPAAPAPTAPPKPKAKPKLKLPLASANMDAYRGLGTWVDVYDYAIRDTMDAEQAVDTMHAKGVRTLYLQTGRWKEPADIVKVETVNLFLERSHLRGMKVVGWYLPGFGDIDRDIRRSLAVLQHASPSGERFDGLAPDIESREELINQIRAQHPDWSDPMVNDEARIRFNAGIAEYSRRLRDAVPAATALGAIVVDAKNNERAPARWAGFPWPEIGKYYEVIVPMAYWSVTKAKGACSSVEFDTAAYMRDVVTKTQALMGAQKPMHLIGGIADCVTANEVRGFAESMLQIGALGGSLYDFRTIEANPARDAIWAEQARLNS